MEAKSQLPDITKLMCVSTLFIWKRIYFTGNITTEQHSKLNNTHSGDKSDISFIILTLNFLNSSLLFISSTSSPNNKVDKYDILFRSKEYTGTLVPSGPFCLTD